MNVRKRLCFVLTCLACIVLFAACKRAYQENQLVGSWRLDNGAADARLTYYSNHTWVLVVLSSDSQITSGTAFGSWRLDGDRVNTTTESALDNKPSKADEIGEITKLTASALVLRNRDVNNKETTSTFSRIEAPTTTLSDEECTAKLLGTWLYSYTNSAKLVGARLYESYQSNGLAVSHGTIYRNGQSSPFPNVSGTWRVENGLLVTAITNSEAPASVRNKEVRDQILQITDSQFSFRDEHGFIKKNLRVQ